MSVEIAERALPVGVMLAPSAIELNERHPLEAGVAEHIENERRRVANVMTGEDPRLMLWLGSCSLDGSRMPDGEYASVHFARQMREAAESPIVRDNLVVGLRAFPIKGRSGQLPVTAPRPAAQPAYWRGLEQDSVDQAYDEVTALANVGLPLCMEVINPLQMARYESRIAQIQVGARRVADSDLWALLSHYGHIPVTFKNGETGDYAVALRAVDFTRQRHESVGIILPDGQEGIVLQTEGHKAAGITWRAGGEYATPDRYEEGLLALAGIAAQYGIAMEGDSAHGAAIAHDGQRKKSVEGQLAAFEHMAELLLGRKIPKLGDTGLPVLRSLKVEANLLPGADISGNTPGMSRTDPGVGLAHAKAMIMRLAEVSARLQK